MTPEEINEWVELLSRLDEDDLKLVLAAVNRLARGSEQKGGRS